jgi:hypothetical protein
MILLRLSVRLVPYLWRDLRRYLREQPLNTPVLAEQCKGKCALLLR